MAATKARAKKGKKETPSNGKGRKTGDAVLQIEGAEGTLAPLMEGQMPYVVDVTIKGTADLFFHRYNVEEVEEKANLPRGSKLKKIDNVDAYVWRDHEDYLCLPGYYLRASLAKVGKNFQDPRSSRGKQAVELVNEVISVQPALARIRTDGKERQEWDYVDKRRVVVQRAAVARSRPCFRPAWEADFQVACAAPGWLPPRQLYQMIIQAGMFQGVGDARTIGYGRFAVTKFEVIGPELTTDPRNIF